ncbi:3945_t:CDS:1, partial [Dentiscutata erythropus]
EVPQEGEVSCPLQSALASGWPVFVKVQDVVLVAQLPHFIVQGMVPVQPEVTRGKRCLGEYARVTVK